MALRRPFKRYVFQWGWGVLFGLFEYNEGVRSNVGTCCNVVVPLQGGGEVILEWLIMHDMLELLK